MADTFRKDKAPFTKAHPYVILCEGIDEWNFIVSYLNKYAIPNLAFPDLFHVYNMDGNEDMLGQLGTLTKLDNYENMKGFLLVRDAEQNWEAASMAVRKRIQDCFHIQCSENGKVTAGENGVKVGFTLLPGPDETGQFQNGTLEDLCLRIVHTKSQELNADQLKTLADSYVHEVETQKPKGLRTIHKNRLHAYLAGTDRFVGLKIGEASNAGCFDFSSPYLDFLKRALLELIG